MGLHFKDDAERRFWQRELIEMDVRDLPGVKKYAQRSDTLGRIDARYALWLLIGAGLMLRVFFSQYRFAVAFDEVNYLKLGVSGYLGTLSNVLHTYWSPLLPSLISLFCVFSENFELAARFVSILAGALLPIPVYLTAKEIFGSKIAVFSAGIVALFPPLAFQSTLILTESLTMFLGAFGVYFGLKLLKRYSVGFALLTGIASGLAYLSHPTGLGFFCIFLFWVLLGAISKLFLIRPWRLLFLIPALFLGFAIVASPYMFYLKDVTGKWTLSAKSSANLKMEAHVESDTDPFRSLDRSTMSVPIDRIFHQGDFLSTSNRDEVSGGVALGGFIRKYIANLSNMLQREIPSVLTTLPMLLLGAGLFGAVWGAQEGKYILYLLSFVFFFWFGLIPAFHLNTRYLMPMWPIVAVFIGRGFFVLYEWLRHFMPLARFCTKRKIDASSIALWLVIWGWILLSFTPEFGRVIARSPDSAERTADPVEQKKAGLWLRQHTNRPSTIMSRGHAVDIYAGNYDIRESVTVPKGDIDDVLDYAKHRNVDYIVLNERYLVEYPRLEFLLGEASMQRDGLERVYADKGIEDSRTVIYKVLK
jgi:4-amino-4-deoxy-L-arabinose transferase-like glycosyltransferase